MEWHELEKDFLNVRRANDPKQNKKPHKNFLLLLILGQVWTKGTSKLYFRDIESILQDLLSEFGTNSRKTRPEFPFYRLQNDGFWEIHGDAPLQREDPSPSFLKENNYYGKLKKEYENLLIKEKNRIPTLVEEILNQTLPRTLHNEVILISNTSIFEPTKENELTSSEFRDKLLLTYNYQCAVCNYDVKFKKIPAGLEAAHIQWNSQNGPNYVENGIALCPTHHNLFDRGLWTLEPESLKFIASEQIAGITADQWLGQFHLKRLQTLPRKKEDYPSPHYIEWHHKWVFKT